MPICLFLLYRGLQNRKACNLTYFVFFFLFFLFLRLGIPVPRARRPPSCSLTLSERNASAVTQRFKLVLRLRTSMNAFVTSLQVTQVTAETVSSIGFVNTLVDLLQVDFSLGERSDQGLFESLIPWMPEEFYQTVSTVLTVS